MGTSALSRTRVLRAMTTLSLGLLSLSAYEGCSSSSPPGGAPDSGAQADSGAPDVTVVPDASDDAGDDDVTDASDEADAPAPHDADTFDCGQDDAGDGLPNHLRCTGLYADWDAKTVDTSVRQYTPGYVLWSDGALKTRFIYLPPGSKIDTSDMDDWVFPVGTKVWKEFRFGTQRIETRLFTKTANAAPNAWIWTTYRWSADEKTATRLDTGEQNINGTYEVPSRNQCKQCHGGRKDMLLGFDAISLGASGAAGITLATLAAQGWLTTAPPASLVIPEDSTGNARAALGWLHANCGEACHNPNGGALAHGTGLFLKISAAQIIAGGGATRVEDLAAYVTSVNVIPTMQPFSQQGYFRIRPGDVSKSLIPTLDGARNNPNIPQMPPIVSHMVVTNGLNLVTTWITSMPMPDGGIVDAGDGG
jgi:hypothetical protein